MIRAPPCLVSYAIVCILGAKKPCTGRPWGWGRGFGDLFHILGSKKPDCALWRGINLSVLLNREFAEKGKQPYSIELPFNPIP